MRYFLSVIAQGSGFASPDERAAIDAFNDKLVANEHWVFGAGVAGPEAATAAQPLTTARALVLFLYFAAITIAALVDVLRRQRVSLDEGAIDLVGLGCQDAV